MSLQLTIKVVAFFLGHPVLQRRRKALRRQSIGGASDCSQSFAPPMLCLLRTFQRLCYTAAQLQKEATGKSPKSEKVMSLDWT